MTPEATKPAKDKVEYIGVWWKEPGQPVNYCLEGDEAEDYMLASAKLQLANVPAGAALWNGERFLLFVRPEDFEDGPLMQHLLGAFGAGTKIVSNW